MMLNDLCKLINQKLDADKVLINTLIDELQAMDSRITLLEYEQKKDKDRRLALLKVLKDPEDEFNSEIE